MQLTKIESMIADLNSIGSREDVVAFATRFALSDAGKHSNDQIIEHYSGQVEGVIVTITQRWYDRCQAFSIRPDGNEVELTIAGHKPYSVKFLDDR